MNRILLATAQGMAATLLALSLVATSVAQAQWQPGGILVPGASGIAPQVSADGSGRVFFAWQDQRWYSIGINVFAQCLTSDGLVAPSWPDTGLSLDSILGYEGPVAIVPDESGGAFVLWDEYRLPNAFVTRVDAQGRVAAGWPASGLGLSSGVADHIGLRGISDGTGGLFAVWTEDRTDYDVYAQHLAADGVPAAGWPSGGLAVATEPGVQGGPFVVPDGGGGILVAWYNSDHGTITARVARILADGAFDPNWPAGGLIAATGTALLSAAPDGAGGIYFATADESKTYISWDANYYLFHIDGDGHPAPGWPTAGVVLCNASDFRSDIGIVPDGSGGVLAVWADDRNVGFAPTQQYALRIAADGTRCPGWAENGNRVSTLAGIQSASHYGSSLVGDGLGGVYVTFELSASFSTAFIQHLGPDGQPAAGWNSDGVALGTLPDQSDAHLASDGAGGAYVAWVNYQGHGIFAQHYGANLVVATDLVLVSAQPLADGVSLLWQGAVSASVTSTVERRTTTSAWQPIGSPLLEGHDQLRFLDRDVVPGTRYGYRLSYTHSGVTQQTTETWIDVPQSAMFALDGARPNPAVGRINVSFSLPGGEPARLSVVDVSGREIMRQEVGALGAGRHVAPFETGARTPPGIYWLRLTQGHRTQTARVAVVR
jgi:hypothetical protein